MVKKKVVIGSSPTANAGLKAHYETGLWSGQLQFKCRLCAFDTLGGEAVMLTHLVEAHNSEAALDALFPANAQDAAAKIVQLQEPAKTDTEGIPEGDPANGVYEIGLEEVGDGTNESE